MRRLALTYSVVIAVALVLAFAASASAEPWPSWSNPLDTDGATELAQPGTGHVYSFTVSKTPIATGWRFTVSVASDPLYGSTGGVKAFIVYLDGLDPLVKYDKQTNPEGIAQGWQEYGAVNSAGWTNLNGGWQWNKYPGPTDTTSVFGWMTGSPEAYLNPGQTYTFDAVNLPAATSFHYAAHIDPQNGTQTYWQREDTPNPPVPEPASLLLLGLGLLPVAVARWRRT